MTTMNTVTVVEETSGVRVVTDGVRFGVVDTTAGDDASAVRLRYRTLVMARGIARDFVAQNAAGDAYEASFKTNND